ncbi:MAG: endonuclease/exonuclease/phosphatase family protein [Calditrichota bacterium]
MKWYCAFLYVSLFSLCCPAGFAQESLKVITYNMQGMRPNSNWSVRLFFMIQFFELLDPDIICLQEINQTLNGGGEDNMARTLAEGLSDHFGIEYHYNFVQTHIGWEQFAEGVGFVTKYPVLAEGARSLPRGDFPRKVAWNRVDTPLGIVNAFSTHLSGDAAYQQVQEILTYISEIEQAYPSVGAVLGGDFNSLPNSDPIRLLVESATDTVYFDTFAELNPGQDGFTVPAEAPTSRIDYIFRRSLGRLQADSSRVVMDSTYDGSHCASDHLGVMTIFSLLPESTEPQGYPAATPRFEIHPAYPNPFNPTTQLSFYVPQSEHVTVNVYNIAGQLVSTLLDDRLTPGLHTVRFDGSSLSSGVYLCRLNAPGFTATQKMVLMK